MSKSQDKPLPLSLVGMLDAAVPLSGSSMFPAPVEALNDPNEPSYDDGDVTPPVDTDWDLVRLCAGEPENDVGNACRLRHRHGRDLIYVQNIGWHAFDGRRWKEDVDGIGTRPRCHETVEAIALESRVLAPTEREAADIAAGEAAVRERSELRLDLLEVANNTQLSVSGKKRNGDAIRRRADDLKAIIERGASATKNLQTRKAQRRRFSNTAGNKPKIDGLLTEAAPYLMRSIKDLDKDKLALNVLNGTLHFFKIEELDPECPDPNATRMVKRWTVRLDPHAREDLISKLADVAYDPDAKADAFHTFMDRILPNPTVLDFVQRWLGYSITALTVEQAFCLFYGEGANGKSTLVDLIARMMGDYSTSVPIDTLVASGGQKKGSEATPDLARLPGARFVRTAEPKEGVAFDEALIKGLTSDEAIPVRRLHGEFMDIWPTFKINISANRKPPIKGDDDGIWRRVNLVPFDVQIPKEERDKQLGTKLWAERSGVLNWLVAGCLDYLNRGHLDPPEVVMAATQEYRQESDVLAPFLAGGVEITKSAADRVESGKLYDAYVYFCRRNGATPIQPTTFARRMAKAADRRGIEKGKSSVSVYIGLKIRPQFVPPDALARHQAA